MGFLKFLPVGKFHRDIKIIKILASNSKHFRIYGISKKWQIGAGRFKYYIFFDKFCFKQPLVLKIYLGMFFDSRNSEMTSKLASNLLVFEL